MKLIAGLGNIGDKFARSRHNVGFMVADELASRWGATWRSERLAFLAEAYKGGGKLLLIKPTTYMNLSGQALAHYAHYFQIAPEEIAVVHDDMDLPSGKVRLRRKGAAGGHNGIRSAMADLGTGEFNRFKIGIGHPMKDEEAVLRHVLGGFGAEEWELVAEAVQKTADALECWLAEGMEKAMNRFNGDG